MFDWLTKKNITDIQCVEDTTAAIAILDESDIEVYRKNGQLIEIDNTVSAGLCKVVESIPGIVARESTKGLYKLNMNGIQGTLMSYKGENTTSIIDETTKKIKGTATISKAGTTSAQALANVMNIASVATGMYYMNIISTRLEHAERLLNGVKQFLEDDKKAEILAIYGELKKIYNDYQFCLSNDGYNEELLNSHRSMLTSIEQKLNKNIEFYLIRLGHKYDEFQGRDNSKVVEETVGDFCDYIITLKQIYDLYCIRTVLEINYASKSMVQLDAYVESRKKLLLSIRERINSQLGKMKEVKKYLANEKYNFLKSIKAMDLEEAMLENSSSANKNIFYKISGYEYLLKTVLVAKSAKDNYKANRIVNTNDKYKEVEHNVGGFEVEKPTKYMDIINNITALNENNPELILVDGKVYLLKDKTMVK